MAAGVGRAAAGVRPSVRGLTVGVEEIGVGALANLVCGAPATVLTVLTES